MKEKILTLARIKKIYNCRINNNTVLSGNITTFKDKLFSHKKIKALLQTTVK